MPKITQLSESQKLQGREDLFGVSRKSGRQFRNKSEQICKDDHNRKESVGVSLARISISGCAVRARPDFTACAPSMLPLKQIC